MGWPAILSDLRLTLYTDVRVVRRTRVPARSGPAGVDGSRVRIVFKAA
jgi:hypothetical protein